MIPNEIDIKLNCDIQKYWLEHKIALKSFINKRVKDPELTNDISQEVLMKLYNFCNSEKQIQNIKSWLFQIAHNTIIDYYRKQSKLSFQKEIPDNIADTGEDENHAFKDAINYIIPLLGFLPEKYAVPLKLSDIEQVKQSEIAQQLGLNLSATKSRIQRARQLLKAEFLTCCNYETDKMGNIISFNIKKECKPLQTFKKQLIQIS